MAHYLKLLILILIFKAGLIVGTILYSGIGLSPDEAQYWTWSQLLDWGYYSKPPAIAWEIWVGTQIFGNNELGVRFGAICVGTLIPLLVFLFSLQCRLTPRAAFWATLFMALSPLGFASSLFATTDGGMVLFWILACMVIAPALRDQVTPNYYLLGLVIALGALFKWPVYLFWLVPLFYRELWSKKIAGGILLSLLGLFPSFVWNSSHDWVTFRHVFSTIKGAEGGGASGGNFFEFLGAQAGLLSPIIFVLFLIAGFSFIKERKVIPLQLRFCASLSFAVVGLIALAAVFKKMQGNWGVFAYPSGLVFTAWFTIDKNRVDNKTWGERWALAGVLTSVLLCLIAITIPSLSLPYRLNPFRHNVGWNQMAGVLKGAGYQSENHFLFGDKYQMSSLLSFYSEGQKRAYFLNLHGIRKNQFSFWPSMADEQLGKTGFFVLAENSPHLEKDPEGRIANYHELLAPYFERVEYLGLKPLYETQGTVVKGAFIFKGIGYNGKMPPESGLY